MTILVFGSINMDLVVKVPRLPGPGETLMGHQFFSAFGGKGANQAVAIAKLGQPVALVGQVGNDDFGQTLLLALEAAKVNVDCVMVNEATHSGVASIVVSATGENTIAFAPGANGEIGAPDLARFTSLLPQGQIVLLELGIPLTIIVEAARAARQAGVTVILDPAPAPPEFPPELYTLVDILTPNEVEASQLLGFPISDPESAERAARIFCQRGVKTAIITLGEQGLVCCHGDKVLKCSAIAVETVDTVAAGDAFNGALAVALREGYPLEKAIEWGMAAGSLAVTKNGAQTSLPDRGTLEKFYQQQFSTK